MKMQISNNTIQIIEKVDRQSGNISNNRKQIPEVVYVRSGRCR